MNLIGISSKLFVVVYEIVFISLSFCFLKDALHMFQQNHYELRRYSKWLFNIKRFRFSYSYIYVALVLLLSILNNTFSYYLTLVITVLYADYLIYKEINKKYIKNLVVTNRVKRQIVVLGIIVIFAYYQFIKHFTLRSICILCLVMPYLFIYIMAVITNPIEETIKKFYENKARTILDNNNSLIKIGVTGSYGKTSTKNIINDIISEDLFTLITPASYNTPMGITLTIRNMLKNIHQVFVCEMGADKVGDISYLMDFVKPKYGVVTSIGPQHLNTFDSIENIINEKMQEIEMLPSNGVGFINLDNEYIKKYKIKNTCKIVSVGIDNLKATYVASNIKSDKNGTKFSVKINKKTYRFSTCLLGKHNITNILIGIALGIELGIDIKKIVENVEHIKQIEHRLQIKEINGLTFIDDAFNANPVGSKMSLDVLKLMPGKKVIVTPGMIDLGAKEDKINEEFGKYMYGKADYVILVGQKQTSSILKGLKQTKFKMDNVVTVTNINEAFSYVFLHFSKKDTILLENDLPDAFNI